MTREELTEIEQNYTESKIQHTCVSWFRQTFSEIGDLLFAVPNGGWRGARAGAQMVYEGQVKGVSDLVLLKTDNGALCIEMKVPKRKGRQGGQQSASQKQWQRLVETHGNTYVICHGLIEFITAVCGHLGLDAEKYIMDALNKFPTYR